MKTFGLVDKICGTTDDSASIDDEIFDNSTDEKTITAYGFKELLRIEELSLEKLTSIHKWIVFFGILTIISLAVGAISLLVLLGSSH